MSRPSHDPVPPDQVPPARPPSPRWGRLDRPPLRAQALRRALTTPSGPFARVEVVAETGSTNRDLAEAATRDPAGWPDLSVLTTDHQSAGRGRLGRQWVAPAGAGLATSVLLRPSGLRASGLAESALGWLPLLGGVAVVDALRTVVGLEAVLKWPNDVLVPADGPGSAPAKVCGVLAELLPAAAAAGGAAPGAGPAVVLGFGVNVTQTAAELAVPTATSLLLAGAAVTDRDTVLRACLRALADRYRALVEADGDAAASGLAAAARECCSTLGTRVRVQLPGRDDLVGEAEGLDELGRLLLRRDGAVQTEPVAAGDVVHLRAGQV